MWFRRSEADKRQARHPGEPTTIHGNDAARRTETLACDVVVEEVNAAAGYVHEGLRTAAVVDDIDAAALRETVGRRLPLVVNLTCRAAGRQSSSRFGGHEAYYAASRTGCFQFFATTPQEVADLTLISHRLSELSLTPGVCAQDLYATSHALRPACLADADFVAEYLGAPGDTIAPPTPGQEILFGGSRRRVPVSLDIDRPVGVGGIQDTESFFRAVASQQMYFTSELARLAEVAMREFGDLTGREYSPVRPYRTDDAEFIVVAQGAVVESLQEVVDLMREKRIRAGLINVAMLRPFPGGRLTELLRGTNVVTVLDRVDFAGDVDPPLCSEVRAAVERATENAMADDGKVPHPGYAAYKRPADGPRILSGVYGEGTELPGLGRLAAVFDNMASGRCKNRFYLGFDVARPDRRFPHLQAMQQRIERAHGDPGRHVLEPVTDLVPAASNLAAAELHSLCVQGGLFAANLFSETVASAHGVHVRTYPEGGLDPNLQPCRFTLVYGDGNGVGPRPHATAVVLVASDGLLNRMPERSSLSSGGKLIVASSLEPDTLWRRIDRRTERWLRERGTRIVAVDARRVAKDADPTAAYVDQLVVWALLGTLLGEDLGVSEEKMSRLTAELRRALEERHGLHKDVVDGVIGSLTRGREAAVEVSLETIERTREPTTEPPAPWTVERSPRGDGSVFDVNRFWHSVGYFYDRGQESATLADPHLATGLMAARSSAFRDMSPFRIQLPRWIPQNCTACALCAATCPESALPLTVQRITDLVGNAVSSCQAGGVAMVQLQRIKDPLCKQAHAIFKRDGLGQYATMDALVGDAFDRLVEKLDLDEEKRAALTTEFNPVRERLAGFPISKTDLFFERAEGTEKGSGGVFSLAVNPLSCTGCGICIEVCPEDALDWTPHESNGRDWELLMRLPAVDARTIAAAVSSDGDPQSECYRLLDRNAYHAMVGGDGSFPARGSKIAAHLIAAAAESIMSPRYAARVGRLDGLIERLKGEIQGGVADTVAINDFADFGRRLASLEGADVTADELARLVGDGKARETNRARLLKLNKLLLELTEQRRRYVGDNGAGGRTKMIVSVDPNSDFPQGTYPYNPHVHPWAVSLPGDALPLAEGIHAGIVRRMASEFATFRIAELELNGAYKPASHESFFENFGWEDFSDEERALVPVVFAYCSASSDHWKGAAAIVSRRYPVISVVLNGQGIETRRGKLDDRVLEDVMSFAKSRPEAWVGQCSIGLPGHLIRAVRDACECHRPALLHVHTPDPLENGILPERVVGQAKRACETRAFPVFVRDPDSGVTRLAGNPEPGTDWVGWERRTMNSSGVVDTIATMQTVADWAVLENRFRPWFEMMSRGHLNDRTVRLSDYLLLGPEEREQFDPYVDLVDEDGQHSIARVRPEMVRMTESALARWDRIAEPVRPRGREAESPAPRAGEPAEAPETAVASETGAYERLTERLLVLCGYRDDPDFFRRSLREFVTREQSDTAAD